MPLGQKYCHEAVGWDLLLGSCGFIILRAVVGFWADVLYFKVVGRFSSIGCCEWVNARQAFGVVLGPRVKICLWSWQCEFCLFIWYWFSCYNWTMEVVLGKETSVCSVLSAQAGVLVCRSHTSPCSGLMRIAVHLTVFSCGCPSHKLASLACLGFFDHLHIKCKLFYAFIWNTILQNASFCSTGPLQTTFCTCLHWQISPLLFSRTLFCRFISNHP